MTDDASCLDRARRICAWCTGPIPARARRDARFCGQSCRQASHRFGQGCVARVAAGHPLRLAYADPPYPGLSRRYYGAHPDFGGEVDHPALIARLMDEFPDGWALSTSAAALHDVLLSCPTSVRVAAWFRGERPTRSWRPLNAWEPVIFHGGRAYASPVDERRIDALVHVARARTTDPNRVVGAKPADFIWWMFDLLGALPGDDLVDLFPGSGGIARAWDRYCEASPGSERRVAPAGEDDTSCRPGADPSCEYSADASPRTSGTRADPRPTETRRDAPAMDDASC